MHIRFITTGGTIDKVYFDDLSQFEIGCWLALAYLTIFGSIVAYTAYIYLLKTVRPGMVASYAYVNPAVAVIAGVTLGGEVFTGPLFVAMPLILIGVAMVTLGRGRRDVVSEPIVALPLVEDAA